MKPSFSELIIDIEFPDPDQMKTYNIYEKQKQKNKLTTNKNKIKAMFSINLKGGKLLF